MNDIKNSSVNMLKIWGCIIFDIALIYAYVMNFGLFFILAPGKSILILAVLLIGLVLLNGIIISNPKLFKDISIPYKVAVITLVILYVVISNVLSFMLIVSNLTSFIIWQLILLSLLIFSLSAVIAFSKKTQGDKSSIEREN